MPQAFRLTPAGRPEQYKTYSILSPVSTHTRQVECSEVECEAHANGWVSRVDVSTDLGIRQAVYIRKSSGRVFKATQEGTIISFTFPAGQRCFAEHRVGIDRPPLYLVRGGDWRGNPHRIPVVEHKPEDWVDDFATHQQRVADAVQKG